MKVVAAKFNVVTVDCSPSQLFLIGLGFRTQAGLSIFFLMHLYMYVLPLPLRESSLFNVQDNFGFVYRVLLLSSQPTITASQLIINVLLSSSGLCGNSYLVQST